MTEDALDRAATALLELVRGEDTRFCIPALKALRLLNEAMDAPEMAQKGGSDAA